MTDLGQARQFAQTMTRLGEAHGVRTAAMITAMDTPLGRAVGNAVEVREALDVLGGCGPGDVRDLVIARAEAMLRLAGIGGDPAEALAGGRALDKFRDMIRAPGRRPQPAAARGRALGTVAAWRDGWSAAWTPGRPGWPHGAWEPGGHALAERCGRPAGVICRAKPGERAWSPASPSWNCAAATRPGWRQPRPNWPEQSRSATIPRPPGHWSWSVPGC